MDPRDFFRGFFGLPRDPRHYGGSQQFPHDDPEDDEDEVTGGHHHHQEGSNEHFDVFTNPLDMERFFNHRMEEMMRGIFGGMLPPGMFGGQLGPNLAPPPAEEESAGSRDFMLRDGYVKRKDEKWEDGEVSLGDLDKMEPPSSPSHHPSRPPQQMPAVPFSGLFSADPFFNGQAPTSPEVHTFSFGQSSSTSFISRPDGSTEETRTTKDSQGNTKTTVKRCLGDKCQVFTTVKRSDGSEERQESSTNMDEAEAEDFGRRWSSRKQQQPPLGHHPQRPSSSSSPRDEMLKSRNDESLFNRFFGSSDD